MCNWQKTHLQERAIAAWPFSFCTFVLKVRKWVISQRRDLQGKGKRVGAGNIWSQIIPLPAISGARRGCARGALLNSWPLRELAGGNSSPGLWTLLALCAMEVHSCLGSLQWRSISEKKKAHTCTHTHTHTNMHTEKVRQEQSSCAEQ